MALSLPKLGNPSVRTLPEKHYWQPPRFQFQLGNPSLHTSHNMLAVTRLTVVDQWPRWYPMHASILRSAGKAGAACT